MTRSARLVLRGRLLTPADRGPVSVLVEDGRVVEITMEPASASGAEVFGDDEHTIAPGFIDLQVNGYGGCDAAAGVEAMVEIARNLPRHGVTAFLPTAISAPPDRLSDFVAAVADAGRRAGLQAARILGAHVEGPFLNPEYAGAHDPTVMRDPTPEEIDRLLSQGPPRLVTVAPERRHALAAIARLSRAGVVVAAGHSGATFEQSRAAFAAGVSFGTHLFNAMSGLQHRNPGLAGALLDDRLVTVGLIADGLHVHPAALGLAFRSKGSARIALTTDQTAAAGSPPGSFRIGDRDLVSDGESVRLRDGTLAGSAATMESMVALVSRLPGAGLAAAVRSATSSPARVLGFRARLGRIAPGLPADITVLGRDGRVRLTLVGGGIAFRAG